MKESFDGWQLLREWGERLFWHTLYAICLSRTTQHTTPRTYLYREHCNPNSSTVACLILIHSPQYHYSPTAGVSSHSPLWPLHSSVHHHPSLMVLYPRVRPHSPFCCSPKRVIPKRYYYHSRPPWPWPYQYCQSTSGVAVRRDDEEAAPMMTPSWRVTV